MSMSNERGQCFHNYPRASVMRSAPYKLPQIDFLALDRCLHYPTVCTRLGVLVSPWSFVLSVHSITSGFSMFTESLEANFSYLNVCFYSAER